MELFDLASKGYSLLKGNDQINKNKSRNMKETDNYIKY